jgi:opacity protein-like surface antigen
MKKLAALLVSLPIVAAAQTSRPELDAAALRPDLAMRTAPQQYGTGPSDRAQPVALGQYLFARAGAIVPKHDDLEGFDTGLAFEGGLGFRTSPNLAFELAVGRYAVEASGPFFDPDVGFVVDRTDRGTAIPVTGTVKLIAPAGSIEAYGLAGAGVYFVSYEIEESLPGVGSGSISDDDTVFGFHFGGGLSAALSPNVTLGAELRYFVTKATVFDVDIGLDSFVIGGTLGYRF